MLPPKAGPSQNLENPSRILLRTIHAQKFVHFVPLYLGLREDHFFESSVNTEASHG